MGHKIKTDETHSGGNTGASSVLVFLEVRETAASSLSTSFGDSILCRRKEVLGDFDAALDRELCDLLNQDRKGFGSA